MNRILKQKYILNDDIVLEPDEVLRKKSLDVKIPLEKDDEKLLRIMYNHVSNSQDKNYTDRYSIRPAVGIAAIQLGVNKKLIAIKTEDENGHTHKYMLVNPKIIKKSDEIIYLSNGEGCLSVEIDKYNGIVPRSKSIVVKGYNLFNKKEEIIEVDNFLAIVFQHELDHLDGTLYFDKFNKIDPLFINEEWVAI